MVIAASCTHAKKKKMLNSSFIPPFPVKKKKKKLASQVGGRDHVSEALQILAPPDSPAPCAKPSPTYVTSLVDAPALRDENLPLWKTGNAAKAWTFFIALSLHGVFEGLAVGATDSAATFWVLLAAMVAHKGFDGIALGVPLLLSNMPIRQAAVAMVVCAAMMPIGIGIALAAEDASTGSSASLTEGITVGLSAGAFIFISIVELLPASLRDGRFVLCKMGVFLLGWLGMMIIAAFA